MSEPLDVHVDFRLDFFPEATMNRPAESAIEMVKKLETDLYTLWDFWHQHREAENLAITITIEGHGESLSRSYTLSERGDTIPD